MAASRGWLSFRRLPLAAYLSPLTSRRLPRLLNRMASHGPGITFALMIRTWAYTFPSALAFDAADNTL